MCFPINRLSNGDGARGVGEAPLKSRINIDKRAQSFTMTSDELFVVPVESILWIPKCEAEIHRFVSKAQSSRNSINRNRFCGVRIVLRTGETRYCCRSYQSFLFSGVHFSQNVVALATRVFRSFSARLFPQRKLQTKATFRRCCCCFCRRFGIDDMVRVNILRGRTKKIKAALKMRFRSLPKKPASIYWFLTAIVCLRFFRIPEKKIRWINYCARQPTLLKPSTERDLIIFWVLSASTLIYQNVVKQHP